MTLQVQTTCSAELYNTRSPGRQRCTPLCLFYLLRSFAGFLVLRFHLFRQLCFLLGSHVADDHFAFRSYLNLKINRHFTMESQRNAEFSQALDWFTQV